MTMFDIISAWPAWAGVVVIIVLALRDPIEAWLESRTSVWRSE